MSTAQEIIDHLSTLDPDTKIATYHPDDHDRVVPLMARSGGVWTEDGELVHILFRAFPSLPIRHEIRHATAAEIAAETFFPGDVVRITDQVSGPALDDLGVGVIGVVTGISDYEDEIEPVEALFGDTYYIFAPEELEVLDDDDLTADVVGPILRSLVEETR